MATQRKQRFSAKRFVDREVLDMMDCYDNTHRQALEFIIEILKEGQYDDELSFSQQASAINRCQKELDSCND